MSGKSLFPRIPKYTVVLSAITDYDENAEGHAIKCVSRTMHVRAVTADRAVRVAVERAYEEVQDIDIDDCQIVPLACFKGHHVCSWMEERNKGTTPVLSV